MMERKRKKRIYNPVTGKYYAVRQRTTSAGRTGQIEGLWRPTKRRRKKSIWDLL